MVERTSLGVLCLTLEVVIMVVPPVVVKEQVICLVHPPLKVIHPPNLNLNYHPPKIPRMFLVNRIRARMGQELGRRR